MGVVDFGAEPPVAVIAIIPSSVHAKSSDVKVSSASSVSLLRLSEPVAIVVDMSERVIGPQVPIRNHREALGISIASLIERIAQNGGPANTHPDTIRNIELGYKRASKTLMAAWARALDLSPVDVHQPAPIKSSLDRPRRDEVA